MNDSASSWFGPMEQAPGVWGTSTDRGSFSRLWRAFMSARVAIASVLVVLQAFVYALGNVSNRWSVGLCVVYMLATAAVRLWARPKPPGSTFDVQWLLTIGVDVVTFSALNFLPSSAINYTPLFAMPVLLASVMGPLLLAMGTAAAVTLLLLADAWWLSLAGAGDLAARFLQSGLSGSGFFMLALLANQLALRLAREEQLARTSQSLARTQRRVNELVVETLADGILVIDSQGIVRSANPASRRLLAAGGVLRTTPFALGADAAWKPLAEVMRNTFGLSRPQEVDVNLQFAGREARKLHIRTRLAGSPDNVKESLCVMFLQDLREMEARVRTEKMAAMGRMSAAVAHEIRNPLAAITQANALLEEDLKDPAHAQLTSMVRQNAQRLAKIVDEILNISRVQVVGLQEFTPSVLLDASVARIADEWTQQCACSESVVVLQGAQGIAVPFDPEHLRRLMINLLDNALRYASRLAASIKVSTAVLETGDVRLSIWSDGAPLEKSVESHLFEPFFSSESRSSGLGLYICRELCERYGAVVAYRRAHRENVEGNEFHVVFRPASRAARPAIFDANTSTA